jgi:hypothetical protein
MESKLNFLLLVSDRHILFAAHYIEGKKAAKQAPPESFKFYFQNDLSTLSFETRIFEIILHPDWNTQNRAFKADIAIAVLTEPLELTNEINHICLNAQPNSVRTLIGQNATIAGWGHTEASKGKTVKLLKSISIPIVDHRLCNTSQALKNIYADTLFCAGKNDVAVGPCKGMFYFYSSAKIISKILFYI